VRRPSERPAEVVDLEEMPVIPDPASGSSGTGGMCGGLLGGRYRLDRELGRGGMGTVYLACDQEVQGEIFAVKVLNAEIRNYPESLAMLREEVRTTRALRHPNIPGVYSLNSDRSDIYMLMEYLEGKPLDDLLDVEFGRGMPFLRAWPLIQDVCGALAYAHDHSVIHSDIKPSNIFVTTAGRAKLLDFGIARVARRRAGRFDPGSMGAVTVAYASCEMLSGEHQPDQRDDVYSLACVIYEMLSGRHPFRSRSAMEARDTGEGVAPIASLTRAQNSELASALAFDRAHRTASVEALLAGLDPTAIPASAPAAAPRNSRPWIAMGIVLMVGGATALGWYFWPGTKHGPGSPADIAGSSANEVAGQVRALVDRARSLEVDPDDPSLQRGKQRIAAAEASLSGGNQVKGKRLLTEAAAEITSAINSGKRVAHIGLSSGEMAQAMAMCRSNGGTRCAAADFSDEAPKRIALSPFELDPREVSNRDFTKFVAATQYVTSAERGDLYAANGDQLVPLPGKSWKTWSSSAPDGGNAADLPVRGVDFNSAKEYCRWRSARLPTETEWEYVARGSDHRMFAWGNEPRTNPHPKLGGPLPVNEQPATGRFGNRGLGDGLLEWVDAGTSGSDTQGDRVLRGSSWLDTNPLYQRLALRRLVGPTQALLDSGLRCARSADSWPKEMLGG